MSLYELRRNNDLIIMDSIDLCTFAKLHASLDELSMIEDCDFWSESYPIYRSIITRLGFNITEHNKKGVCITHDLVVNDFNY